MNLLKQCYQELHQLQYSEENIAELFSIANKIIRFLKSKNPSRKTNKSLHFVMLTKEREFQNFKDNQHDNLKDSFIEAKSSLMSDLLHYCNEYWEPDRDFLNN